MPKRRMGIRRFPTVFSGVIYLNEKIRLYCFKACMDRDDFYMVEKPGIKAWVCNTKNRTFPYNHMPYVTICTEHI